MSEQLWAEIEKNHELLKRSYYFRDTLLEGIKEVERNTAKHEAGIIECQSEGFRELEEGHLFNAQYYLKNCIYWYDSLAHHAEFAGNKSDKLITDSYPPLNSEGIRAVHEEAAQLRALIPQIQDKIGQLTQVNEKYKARYQEIKKTRIDKETREKQEAEAREREEQEKQQAAEEHAEREREAAEQQARELQERKDQARRISSVLLGRDTTTQQPVYLADAARQYSLYIIGTPGVGKSNLLESIGLQDMQKGDGLCFLDPHGDSAQQLLRLVPQGRREDVIFWDPKDLTAPIGLNPFYCDHLDNPVEVDRKVEDFISALSSLQEFTEVFKQAPQMLDILRHMAFACVLKRGTTLLDTVRFLTNGTYRQSFYPALHHYNRKDILEYWDDFDEKTPHRKEELTSSSLNKLRRLATTSITRSLFQGATPTINFRNLMDEGKILLVDLSGLGEGNGELLGAFIVFDILRAALSRGNIPERARRPFHLFADEFERFMTTAFPRIIDEGRKFKLSCVLAHQHRGQLSGSSIGSTLGIKNKVVFRVNSADAAELAAGFDTTPPPPDITGEQSVRTLALDPWQRLFFEEKPHSNPEVNAVVERVALMFYCREVYRKSEALTAFNVHPSFKPLLEKYKGISPPYPFILPTIDLPDGWEVSSKGAFKFTAFYYWQDSHLLGDRYLLSCEQGAIDEVALQEMIDNFCKTDRRARVITTKPMETERDKEEDRLIQERMWSLYDEAKIELQRHVTAVLRELGDLLCQEENHIKIDSGQYEPVLGSLRTYNDMVGEIANTLTKLPRFTARCIVDEYDESTDESRPVEYLIRTLPPADSSDDAEEQAQAIIAHSRQLYGRKQNDDTSQQHPPTPDGAERGILEERKPADAEPSHPLSGHGTQPPATEEDDYFR